MKKINSVSLIGLGAIGAAYGTRLHDSLAGSFRIIANDERIFTNCHNSLANASSTRSFVNGFIRKSFAPA